MTGWTYEHVTATASELHAGSALAVAPPSGRGVRRGIRVLDATGPAVVLGRAQRDDVVDRGRARRAGVEVVRRASGGGAVFVGPGQSLWVDLVVPVDDPLWAVDVGRAMWWVGEAWCHALRAVADRGGLDAIDGRAPSVWRGPLVRTAWSDLVCFAGLGPGEVSVDAPSGVPMKVVGISQRRTRLGALFQCAAVLRWHPRDLLDVLTVDEEARREAEVALRSAAVGLGPSVAAGLADALVAALAELGPVSPSR